MSKTLRYRCALTVAGLCGAVALCVVLPQSSAASPPGLSGESFSNWTPPSKADLWRTLLVGPIEGLTTDWHLMPDQCAVPVGTVLTFKYKAGDGAQYEWEGAVELEGKSGPASMAICPLLVPGEQAVSLTVTWNGQETNVSCSVHVLPISISDIQTTSEIAVDPDVLEIDQTLPEAQLNALTVEHYFGDSIASVETIGPGTYRTTIDKDIPISISVEPAEMSPLIEWRVNGQAAGIGAGRDVRIGEVGWHQLSGGPPSIAKTVTVQTYEVFITSHKEGDTIVSGEPLVFTAATDPPGFEDKIVWLASTKYGTGLPIVGTGPVFTTEFNDLWGPAPTGADINFQWLGCKASNASFGQDQKQFKDEFNDSTPGPRYTTFGNATIVEGNGVLKVTMFDDGSGLSIDTSDLSFMTCMRIDYEIDGDMFDIGTSLKFGWIAPSITMPGKDFEALSLSLTRPFWNRCQYEVKQNDNDGVTIGFTGPYTEGTKCPDGSTITLDWLPKQKDDKGVPRQVFEIELSGGVVLKNPYRIEGKDYDKGAGGTPIFTHEDNQIKNITITKIAGCDDDESPGKPFMISIDTLTIEDVHVGSGAEAVAIEPDVLERGDVTAIAITTENPSLIPGITTLDMGPEVFINSFNVLSPTEATANIQVDARARNAGHWLLLETDGFFLSGDFNIAPIDPADPLPPNVGPDVVVNAPTEVTEGEAFSIDVLFDDVDDQFIQGLLVIMELVSTAEVFASGYFFVDTSGGPALTTVDIPGLPAGDYKIVVLANDGLAPELPVEMFLTVFP